MKLFHTFVYLLYKLSGSHICAETFFDVLFVQQRTFDFEKITAGYLRDNIMGWLQDIGQTKCNSLSTIATLQVHRPLQDTLAN